MPLYVDLPAFARELCRSERFLCPFSEISSKVKTSGTGGFDYSYMKLSPKRNIVRKHFFAEHPNQIWVSDVPHIKYQKREEIYRQNYHSERDLRISIDRYITFYDHGRPHRAKNYRPPETVEQEFFEK